MESITVLLVEDNKLLRDWISSNLENCGFQVFAPSSVGEALDLARNRTLNVLVSDWRLPDGYDGIEVLEHVRSAHPQVLAVLISADADTQLGERACRAGFDAFLEKPFPPWKIAELLSHLVEVRALEAA